jgi:hypothetical protein
MECGRAVAELPRYSQRSAWQMRSPLRDGPPLALASGCALVFALVVPDDYWRKSSMPPSEMTTMPARASLSSVKLKRYAE